MTKPRGWMAVALGGLLVAGAVALALIAWIAGVGPDAPGPIGTSANGPIAFVRSAGREADLLEVEAISGEERVWFAGRGTVSTPAWSADGRSLAYAWRDPTAGGYRIRVADADGSNDRPVTPGDAIDASPAWSPEGDRIAFSSNRDGPRFGVFVMAADGSAPVRLVDGQDPAWSPTGEWIAFVRLVDGARDVFLIRPDGRDLRNITAGRADDTDPAWTPDGTGIIFASDRGGDFDLYRTRPEGGTVTRLTEGSEDDRSPAVSPDGALVAFSRQTSSSADLWVVGEDGVERRLTDDPLFDVDPAWQPHSGAGQGAG